MNKRKHTSAFKVKVVLEALSERFTIQELGRKYDLHPGQITNWKTQFLKISASVFDKPVKDAKSEAQEKEDHYLKVIGQQKMEIDFLKSLIMIKNASQRKKHIDKVDALPITRQCNLLEINRSNFYYKPVGESALNLELMRLIDEEYLLHPWLRVPRMTTWFVKDKGWAMVLIKNGLNGSTGF